MASYEQVCGWFSRERMGPYLADAKESHELAIRLYDWNAEISGAFIEVMHHVEVVLRNRVHSVMSEAFPDDPAPWFRQEGIFVGDKAPRLVAEAIDRITRDGAEATTGRILASLPFGFWNGLFVRAYSPLWATTLNRCFIPKQDGGPGKRERVVEVTERVKLWRNRIAHHERLIHLDMRTRHDDLLKLAMWIDADARAWILERSRVKEVLARRPR